MLNTIQYGEPGDAPTIVIAHGLFGSARNWGVIAKRLSDTRHVVAVDMRNHGESPRAPTQSYPDMAGDLAEVIETLPGGRADVLGHSMGGKAAMVLALTQPERVNRMIVADIAPVAYTHTQTHNIDAMRRVTLDTFESRQEAAAQMGIDDPGVSAFLLQSLDLKARRWRLELDTLEREMPAIVGFPDMTTTFDGPTLFLSGGNSDYVLGDHRNLIKGLFSGAKFAKIPGAGHWLHAEKPREFEATVRAFFGDA